MPAVPEAPDAKLARREREDALGRDIIDECRVQLMLKFRFLDLALWRMDLEPMRVGAAYPLATDAKRVLFDPPRVIGRFQLSFDELVRDYLHLVMHCIFRHPFNEDHDNREAWNLTCDIIVESAVMDLCGSRFSSEEDADRRQAVSEIRMLVGNLLPGKVYALVKSMVLTPEGQQYRGLGRSTLNAWHDLFERDDHGAWPANNDARSQGDDAREDAAEEMTEDDENPDVTADPLRTDSPSESTPEDADAPHDASAGEEESQAAGADDAAEEDAEDADAGADADGASPDEPDEPEGADEPEDAGRDRSEGARDEHDPRDAEREEKEWEDISKQIEMNLETFSKEWGDAAGSLMANLALANRKRHSYTDFLRRFMVHAEEMQLNMDEFDYIYYAYGMDLYGNMPLVEPLEYQETERVRDFAIVIDTSESVSGELVRKFLRHTFDVLKSSESYANEVNIHVIQCDAKVQADTRLGSLRDVERMMQGFQVRGFGGTDFRPAFDYVEMLRRRGELADMKGLIYYTDGLGTFPEKTPDYDVAFVFMDDEERMLPPVPPWAMKVVVDENGIDMLRPS
ncbi:MULTISPECIES: VWA-like domain-containing protein [unclassified Adlercreutzia]|uniref:VWA-like domain-containing protein n=1 Tax=unclassified Adlercreutzia TaxID=2636013 RepID=UPI0013EC0882|nr:MULTISPECIES: VWA-like domain-containing protein [unclassified Adlercreutzia]